MSERFTAPQDDALYLQMCAEIEEKLRRAAPLYTRRYPHVSTLPAEGLRYTPEENNLWTSSFLPGMMCLAAKRTRRRCVPAIQGRLPGIVQGTAG